MARLHLIKHIDIENTYWGISVSLWFNGCPHRCIGCWNANTWDIDMSLEIPNEKVIEETLIALDEYFPKDLSLLGGEPLAPYNIKDTIKILEGVLTQRPETRVICWTGYTFEEIIKSRHKEVLNYIDVLIDGKYQSELHVDGHKFGSSNQRIIDVKESLKQNKLIIAPENFID